jgi:hypothetical protein
MQRESRHVRKGLKKLQFGYGTETSYYRYGTDPLGVRYGTETHYGTDTPSVRYSEDREYSYSNGTVTCLVCKGLKVCNRDMLVI